MHHGTCLTHVPWCMSGSLTSGFLWNRLREKRSRHSRRMRNPQFCVSGKRPIGLADGLAPLGARPSAGTTMTFEEGQHISPPKHNTPQKYCLRLCLLWICTCPIYQYKPGLFWYEKLSGGNWALVGITPISVSVRTSNFLYKICLLYAPLTQWAFVISHQYSHLCIFVTYTMSDSDQTVVNEAISRILRQ